MNIRNLAKQNKHYVIDLRREFHRFPEESWEEEQTSKKIRYELDKLGIQYEIAAKNGVIATIHGKCPGRTVALRADMDAIKVNETTGAEFQSQNEGIMHACGHDGHMAMLIGAAKILKELEDKWNGTIKLIFQPAEEVAQGAKKVIEENHLKGVEGIFGIHLWSEFPSCKVSVEPGPRMACVDRFTIKIKGSGGHGALPHEGVDALVAASALVMNIQTAVSREISAMEPVVISIGKLQAGTRFNVIASEAILEGTARCFNDKVRKSLPAILERICKNTAATFRAEAELEYSFMAPITINDEKCSEIAKKSVEKISSKESIALMDRLTVSEDLGRYFEHVPGVLAFVGVRNEAKGAIYPQHHEKYTIDEDALEIGTALYAQYALDFLEDKKF